MIVSFDESEMALIYAAARTLPVGAARSRFLELVSQQMKPRGRNADLADAISRALNYLRQHHAA